MNARLRLDSAVNHAYGATCMSSNTLQRADRGRDQAIRAQAIEATVQALAHGSDPRLDQTLALP